MYAGFMGEHSIMDGTPTVRLCDEVLDALASPSFDHGVKPSGQPAIPPTPLDWEISAATAQAIMTANAAALDLINSQVLSYYLTSYGKDEIKKFGVSPDSWAQMIIQLAYRRTIGNENRKGGTYEAATTRKFYKGRTEAIRVVTSESDAWVESMDNPNASNATRKELFNLATKKHVALAKLCGAGQGIDRHILGMLLLPVFEDISRNSAGLKKLLAESEETPALFSDPVFTRSSYWVLSTSAIFSKHFNAYGWGEVVPDGFGVAYMTGHNGLFCTLAYFTVITDRLDFLNFIPQIVCSTLLHLGRKCLTPNLLMRLLQQLGTYTTYTKPLARRKRNYRYIDRITCSCCI